MKFLIILLVLIIPFNVYTQDKSIGVLFFNSEPLGAQVCINDSLCGVTPLELYNLKTGTYNFKFILDSLVVNKYNINYKKGENRELFAMMHSDYGILNVNSIPDSATVFLNADSIGVTPLERVKIPIGVHILRIEKENYLHWEKKFIGKANQYSFATKLDFWASILKFEDNRNDIKFLLDDIPISNNLYLENKVDVGQHKITVQGDNIHKDYSTFVNLKAHDVKNVKFEYGHLEYISLFYSALIPGLGQILDGSEVKGTAILISNILFGGLAVTSINSFNSKVNSYDEVRAKYLSTENNNEFLAYKYSDQLDKKYDEAKNSEIVKNISIAIFIGGYLYNLIDTYLNHTIGGRIVIENEISNDINLGINQKLNLKLNF